MDWVKEKMYQARLQRNQIKENGHVGSPDDRMEDDAAVPTTRSSRIISLNQKLSWLAGGVALGLVVSMVWRVDLTDEGDVVSGNTLEQHRPFTTSPAPSDNNEMKEELVNLTEQVQLLTTTVADLQATLLENNTVADLGKAVEPDGSQLQVKADAAVKQLEVMPPPAAVLGNVDTLDGDKVNKSEDITRGTLTASIELPIDADERKPQEITKESGPWVINLVSLQHKADAERFMEKAESRGVDAGLYQVTVKGKTYWRVHVPGFASGAEAKSNSKAIKDKLGLKDVWVVKR